MLYHTQFGMLTNPVEQIIFSFSDNNLQNSPNHELFIDSTLQRYRRGECQLSHIHHISCIGNVGTFTKKNNFANVSNQKLAAKCT